ncbi:MAG: Hsp20/alpha crystallin family protein [Lachnospiraceae bacterium]
MMSTKHYPMKSDIREKKDNYLLEIDLPGCRKEDIKAYVDKGYLHITASMNEEREKGHGKYLKRECCYGRYERTFFIGSEISQDDLEATYKHGVLRVRIPKAPQTKNNKTIAIEG